MSVVVTNEGVYEWTFYSYGMMSMATRVIKEYETNLAHIHVLVEEGSSMFFFRPGPIMYIFVSVSQRLLQSLLVFLL